MLQRIGFNEFLKDKYIHEIMAIIKTQNIFFIHKVSDHIAAIPLL